MEERPTDQPTITEAAKQLVDDYTLKTRKKTEVQAGKLQLGLRIRQAVEGANRKFWYGLFRKWFNNPTSFDRIPIADLKSICLIPYGDAIGDLIVALPICRAIKRRNRACKIGIIVSHRNEALLRCDPDIDEKYLFRDRLDVTHYSEIVRARKEKYQIVLVMRFDRMTEFALLANIISPKGIKLTTSHARKDLYQILFNYIGPFRRHTTHLSQLGLLLLNSAIDFGKPVKQWESRPTLTICEDARAKVNTQIKALLAETGATWFIYFNIQARNPFREWGTANIAEFSRRFAERYPDAAIFFTASPVRHKEVKKEIDGKVFKSAKFFNTTYDLLEIGALAEASRLVITPDTSVLHFGIAMERPTLTFWPHNDNLPLE